METNDAVLIHRGRSKVRQAPAQGAPAAAAPTASA